MTTYGFHFEPKSFLLLFRLRFIRFDFVFEFAGFTFELVVRLFLFQFGGNLGPNIGNSLSSLFGGDFTVGFEIVFVLLGNLNPGGSFGPNFGGRPLFLFSVPSSVIFIVKLNLRLLTSVNCGSSYVEWTVDRLRRCLCSSILWWRSRSEIHFCSLAYQAFYT